MDNAKVDTVTPLDGNGKNVTGLDKQVAAVENVQPEDYQTKGQTTVATRRGYRFVPSDKNLPVVTHTGVKMTKDEAEKVTAESGGLVRVVDNDENQEG